MHNIDIVKNTTCTCLCTLTSTINTTNNSMYMLVCVPTSAICIVNNTLLTHTQHFGVNCCKFLVRHYNVLLSILISLLKEPTY